MSATGATVTEASEKAKDSPERQARARGELHVRNIEVKLDAVGNITNQREIDQAVTEALHKYWNDL